MKYPKWFPYPLCWVKAIALFAYLGVAFRISLFWGIISVASGVKSEALLVVLFLPFLLLAIVHHICIGAKSKWHWFPNWCSWRTSINALIIGLLACLIAVLIFYPLSNEFSSQILDYDLLTQQELENDAVWYTIIALIIAAYLYHYDYLVRQRRKQKRLAKMKPAKQ